MEINFCDERLKTLVSSNKVTADGFEVQNLLTNNSNGFRVEYFVKPPIDVLFSFAFPIDIRKVVCNLKVGERRTTVVQCFLAYENHNFQLCGHFETSKDIVSFVNTRFRANQQKPNISCNCTAKRDDNVDVYYVPRKYEKLFVKVLHLKLQLLKAQNSGICVLKSVKIYGQPNHSVVNNSDVISVLDSYQRLLNSTSLSLLANHNNNRKRKEIEQPEFSGASKKKTEIPSEFLDPITSEIMLLPMILPSGNIVDKSTLDKYIENEASWGRPANDPFTSISFKKFSEPLPNTELKLRIDSFLTSNCDILEKEQLPVSRVVVGYNRSSKIVDPLQAVIINEKCIVCLLEHSCDEVVYKLPCGHLICRKLYTETYKTYQQRCCVCSLQYSSQNIIRYFSKRSAQSNQLYTLGMC